MPGFRAELGRNNAKTAAGFVLCWYGNPILERPAMTMRPTPATARPAPGEDAVDDFSIVYPSSDGEPMSENDFQFTVMIETATTLRQRYADRPDVYVGGDMLMYYRMNDNQTRVSPDVFAVFGVTDKRPRNSWIVWREGKPPDFVLEVAAPDTWRREGAAKRGIYAEMGVPEYWRFDPTGECFSPPLAGERLGDDGQYHPIPLDTDAEGYLRGRSEVLGLDLCASLDGRLRLYDPVSGQWLRNHYEAEAALEAEAAQREAEAARREAAEAVLEATVVTLGAEQAARQAAEAAQQVEAEARRAAEAAQQAEAAARQAAEDEVRRLRERLRELESG